MTHEQEVEQRWERRGIAALLLLALTLVLLVGYSVIQTSNDRAAAADRAERTAAELHVLAGRLDEQTAALDRQAAALEVQAQALQEQAAALESRTARAERSREQFRAAAKEILEQLGSDLEAFEPADGRPVSSLSSSGRVVQGPGPTVEPEPEPAVTETVTVEPVPPGCDKSGGKPSKCDGDG